MCKTEVEYNLVLPCDVLFSNLSKFDYFLDGGTEKLCMKLDATQYLDVESNQVYGSPKDWFICPVKVRIVVERVVGNNE